MGLAPDSQESGAFFALEETRRARYCGNGTIRRAPSILSSAVICRDSGVTHTVSLSNAARHTKPGLQVSGPYAPPFGKRLSEAARFSARMRSCVSGVTHTLSRGCAWRQTKGLTHAPRSCADRCKAFFDTI